MPSGVRDRAAAERLEPDAATRVVLLGRQGAGKGTQAERLAQHFGVARISTGDMFRAGAREPGKWGDDLCRSIEAGELIPDDVVVAMVAERLAQPDVVDRGFVIEGFPRTAAQAEALDRLLRPSTVEVAVELVVPTQQVLSRLAGRRVCSVCGANYSVALPPRRDWTCDVCGGPVVERPDDRAAAISRRLALYEEQTAPLVDWYRATGRLVTVDGTGVVDDVTKRLLAAVEERRDTTSPER